MGNRIGRGHRARKGFRRSLRRRRNRRLAISYVLAGRSGLRAAILPHRGGSYRQFVGHFGPLSEFARPLQMSGVDRSKGPAGDKSRRVPVQKNPKGGNGPNRPKGLGRWLRDKLHRGFLRLILPLIRQDIMRSKSPGDSLDYLIDLALDPVSKDLAVKTLLKAARVSDKNPRVEILPGLIRRPNGRPAADTLLYLAEIDSGIFDSVVEVLKTFKAAYHGLSKDAADKIQVRISSDVPHLMEIIECEFWKGDQTAMRLVVDSLNVLVADNFAGNLIGRAVYGKDETLARSVLDALAMRAERDVDTLEFLAGFGSSTARRMIGDREVPDRVVEIASDVVSRAITDFDEGRQEDVIGKMMESSFKIMDIVKMVERVPQAIDRVRDMAEKGSEAAARVLGSMSMRGDETALSSLIDTMPESSSSVRMLLDIAEQNDVSELRSKARDAINKFDTTDWIETALSDPEKIRILVHLAKARRGWYGFWSKALQDAKQIEFERYEGDLAEVIPEIVYLAERKGDLAFDTLAKLSPEIVDQYLDTEWGEFEAVTKRSGPIPLPAGVFSVAAHFGRLGHKKSLFYLARASVNNDHARRILENIARENGWKLKEGT